MRIFRLFLFLCVSLCWVAPLGAAQADLTDFLKQRNAEETDIQALFSRQEDRPLCFKSKSHIICTSKKNINQPNPSLELALFRTLQAQAKYHLARTIAKFIPNSLYRNTEAAAANFSEQVKGGNKNYRLAGVETSTFKAGTQLFAVAAIPMNGLPESIKNISSSKQFSLDYCAYLFPTAKRRYESGDYLGALEILKEAHDLKWARADAYIMAARSFMKIGENKEAEKISIEVLSLLQPQLTADLAEELGNILLLLGKEVEAKKAFEIAMEKFVP